MIEGNHALLYVFPMSMAPENKDRKKRACVKIAAILMLAAVTVAVLAPVVNDAVLDELKHTLSLWSIIALVVVINVVSFACFVIFYMAYRWVRRDLKPRADDELDV